MGADLPLFPGAPEQHPPAVVWTDEHYLERCARCDGTGRVECPYPSRYSVAPDWDPTCRYCRGAGHRIWHVGKVRDA